MLQELVAAVAFSLVASLAAIVLMQMMTGAIRMRGLLCRKVGDAAGAASPERVQLLITTIGIAAMYLMSVARSADRTTLPEIDATLLSGVVGSHAVFLASKAVSAFRARRQDPPTT